MAPELTDPLRPDSHHSGWHALPAVEILCRAIGRHGRKRLVVALRASEHASGQEAAPEAARRFTRCLPRRRVVDDGGSAVLPILREDIAAHIEPPAVACLMAERRQTRPMRRPGSGVDGPPRRNPGILLFRDRDVTVGGEPLA